MNIPDNLKYTKDHEWVKIEENIATIGVTDYAQQQLGDIVFTELPSIGETISKDDTYGVLESVKAVSDCLLPISGKITEVNNLLTENPEIINEDCYGEGWMIKVEVTNKTELEDLFLPNEYEAFVKEESA